MSLTPENRAQEATAAAIDEGFWNGVYTLVPSIGVVALAVRQSPTFRNRTNMQSRTAIALMPALFVSALSSELKLSNKMHEMAHETQHTHDTVHWAEQQWKEQGAASTLTEAEHLSALYRESISSSGVRIVPQLQWYHRAANYTAENPLKILSAVAVPSVAYIFYGRTHQSHLQLQSQIMHTRIYGQFFTIAGLLGVIGFQNFMHNHGRYVSQEQADLRVAEMQRVRQEIVERQDAEERREQQQELEIRRARALDKEQRENSTKTAVSA